MASCGSHRCSVNIRMFSEHCLPTVWPIAFWGSRENLANFVKFCKDFLLNSLKDVSSWKFWFERIFLTLFHFGTSTKSGQHLARLICKWSTSFDEAFQRLSGLSCWASAPVSQRTATWSEFGLAYAETVCHLEMPFGSCRSSGPLYRIIIYLSFYVFF